MSTPKAKPNQKASKNYSHKELNSELTKAMLGEGGQIGYEIASHWKLLVALVLGLAVLIAAFFWTAEYRQKNSRKAQHALAAAETVEELQSALGSYGESTAASAAHLKLARLFLADKKYDEAVAEFKQAADKAPTAYLNAVALLNQGYALELAGKNEEAVKAFETLARKSNAPAALAAEANYCAGRLLTAGKELKQAVALLETVKGTDRAEAGAVWNEMSLSLLRSIQAGEFGTL